MSTNKDLHNQISTGVAIALTAVADGEDVAGKKYGKWLVLWHCGGSFWMCRCECGLRKRVDGRTIRNGISTGCHSCHNKTANLKHGMCCSSEYVI